MGSTERDPRKIKRSKTWDWAGVQGTVRKKIARLALATTEPLKKVGGRTIGRGKIKLRRGRRWSGAECGEGHKAARKRDRGFSEGKQLRPAGWAVRERKTRASRKLKLEEIQNCRNCGRKKAHPLGGDGLGKKISYWGKDGRIRDRKGKFVYKKMEAFKLDSSVGK